MLMDHATCVVQPGRVDRSVVNSLHHGSLIVVVAASDFLGTTRARNIALPLYVIRSHYVTNVDNKPRQVSHCCKTCIRCCGVRVPYWLSLVSHVTPFMPFA
jgi:alanine dehydrogenase